jgi:acetoin utilization protein AcuB
MDKLTIRACMTRAPHTIGADQPLTVASALMRAHRIRHLPVLSEGRLVGLLSERDIALVQSMPGVKPGRVIVEEAMSQDPYTISPDSSLEWVVMQMAEHKYGSTVVVEDNRVVGVFTTVDALRTLQSLLGRARRRRKPTRTTRKASA